MPPATAAKSASCTSLKCLRCFPEHPPSGAARQAQTQATLLVKLKDGMEHVLKFPLKSLHSQDVALWPRISKEHTRTHRFRVQQSYTTTRPTPMCIT